MIANKGSYLSQNKWILSVILPKVFGIACRYEILKSSGSANEKSQAHFDHHLNRLSHQSHDYNRFYDQVLEEVCSSRRKLRCWWSSRQIRLLDLACGGDVDEEEDEDDRDGDEDEEGGGNVKDQAYMKT